MKSLVIGTGGREHALARSLARDPDAEVHAAPGNPGIAEVATLHDVDPMDGAAVAALAARLGVDLVVVGPEAPLVAGVADPVRAAGIAVYGPSREAARLEGSKAFSKDVMAAAGVPTARSLVCTTPDEAAAALDALGAPYVVKDDGLAAGKGVVVTTDRAEALAHAAACERVVVEEFLDGPEVSIFAVCDGHHGEGTAARAGLQADLRRRSRPQHRRHGVVLAAAVGAARPRRPGPRDRRPADAGRDGAPWRPLRRHPVRRARAHRRRPTGDRVQLPLRRPRHPTRARAADLLPRRPPQGGRRRRPGHRTRPDLRRRRLGDRGDGQRGLPRVVVDR